MKRTAKYVALDVHQATIVVSVRSQGGRVIARSILPTEASALLEFFGGMRGSIHVAFEEGTQAQWLHHLLVPVVDRIVVCDRRGEHRGNKADQRDADQLSQRLLTGDLRAVYHGSADRLTLQELIYAHLPERGRGFHAHNTATQVPLPRPGDPRTRQACLFGKGPGAVAEPDPGSGRAIPCAGALCAARRAPRVATEGEGCHDGGGTTGSGVRNPALDCLRRARAGGATPGHPEDALAVPDQAQPVGVCRPGRGDPVQRRPRVRRRPAPSPPAQAAGPAAST
jgi:hypothetical protein